MVSTFTKCVECAHYRYRETPRPGQRRERCRATAHGEIDPDTGQRSGEIDCAGRNSDGRCLWFRRKEG